MYDLSKEKSKKFLIEANQYLQEQLISANKKIYDLENLRIKDEEICRKLADELHILRQKFFDSKQEKLKSDKQKTKGRRKDKILHNKNNFEQEQSKVELNEEKILHEMNNLQCSCGKDDCHLIPLKNCFEESSEIDVIERKYVIKRHLRQKYKGIICGKMLVSPIPTKLTKGGKFSIQMGVEVACDKFEKHIPLERQRKDMKNHGLSVDTKTLYGLTEHVENKLNCLPELIKKDILDQKWVHLDESPMSFFNPNKSKGYVWTLSNNTGTYYQFEPTRSGKVARELLGEYSGNVVTDAYSGYNFLEDMSGIQHALCWSHLRRKFYDSISNYPQAEYIVVLIDRLFDIEHKAATFDEMKQLRVRESFIIYDEILDAVNTLKGKFPSSTSIAKAINYFLTKEEKFKRFLLDPYIPISNNKAEQSQRDAVMGRKNYLFYKSINGADIAMFYYTVIGTCKTLGIIPRGYLLQMTINIVEGKEILTPLQYANQLRQRAENKVKSEIMSIPQAP